MNYQIYPPCKALSGIVKNFWTFEGIASKTSPFTLRTMASGFPELIFHYKGIFSEVNSDNNISASFTAGIHGQTNKYRDFIVFEDFGMIGVHLFPFVVKPLFQISSAELVDELPELTFSKKWKQTAIESKISQSKNNEERISILSKYITSCLTEKPNPLIAHSVNKIIETKGNIDINTLSRDSFYSHRQFERIFKEATGFTAKHFSRLIRFNQVIQGNHIGKSLTEVAFDFGYYDQSHFINEFKEFSGFNPKKFFNVEQV